jgi:hypothetical protein
LINVKANVPNFSWKAVSDSDWLTITAGTSGSGNGTIQYSEAPNMTGSPRKGTITVAGVSFQVTQLSSSNPAR